MDFFKRHFSVALFAVLGLVLVAYIGARGKLQIIFGVVVPYLAILIFVEGFVYRLIQWARSPVPFKIPTTAAQHKSLDWIERDQGDPVIFEHAVEHAPGEGAEGAAALQRQRNQAPPAAQALAQPLRQPPPPLLYRLVPRFRSGSVLLHRTDLQIAFIGLESRSECVIAKAHMLHSSIVFTPG